MGCQISTAEECAEVVDDMVNVVARAAFDGPIRPIAYPGRRHAESGGRDQVSRNVFDHQRGAGAYLVPPQQFELLSGGEALTTYQFNTNTARHTFCRYCGIHPFYTPRSHPDHVDVNARCLDGIDVAILQPRMVDGQDWEATWGLRTAEGG